MVDSREALVKELDTQALGIQRLNNDNKVLEQRLLQTQAHQQETEHSLSLVKQEKHNLNEDNRHQASLILEGA